MTETHAACRTYLPEPTDTRTAIRIPNLRMAHYLLVREVGERAPSAKWLREVVRLQEERCRAPQER
jgi:hypothetical protein